MMVYNSLGAATGKDYLYGELLLCYSTHDLSSLQGGATMKENQKPIEDVSSF